MRSIARALANQRCLAALLTAFALAPAGCGGGRQLTGLTDDSATGMIVAGTVSDAPGAPVANVVVTLETVENGLSATVRHAILAAAASPTAPPLSTKSVSAGLDVRATTTDSRGRYAFQGVTTGDYLVGASTRNHLTGTHSFHVVASAAETTYVDIALTPTGTLSGTVELEGEDLWGGSVVSVKATSIVAVTDLTGAYVLRDVPLGPQVVRAMHVQHTSSAVTPRPLAFAGDSVVVATMTLPIDRNVPPLAQASVVGTCTSAPIEFHATASDPDGTIEYWSWDIDNDDVPDYTDPTNGSFTTTRPPGTYVARLTVRDDGGLFKTSAVTYTVDARDTFFVSASTGSSLGSGRRSSPLASVSAALALASVSSCHPLVMISNETYTESVQLRAGVDVSGGNSLPGWQPAGYTIVNVPNAGAAA